jgi:hypothetical protein
LFISKPKKLILRLAGGIGNQLFSYAAARRLAYVNDAELVIDKISGFTNDFKYQRNYQLSHFNIPFCKTNWRDRLEPFSRLQYHLKREWNKKLPFNRRNFIFQEKIDYDQRFLGYKIRGKVHMEGYWQSERYFKDIEHILQKDLKITSPIDKKSGNIKKKNK